MSEKPILFSGQMVRAILDGSKTQTRRVITEAYKSKRRDGAKLLPELLQRIGVGHACPYGVPGDRLWVRECWRLPSKVPEYKATADSCEGPWKPSIHMPRWASRITLEITEVRVERLREITGEDALNEGIEVSVDGGCSREEAVQIYRGLWDRLNAKRGFPWSRNPWVWVIAFRRIMP